MSILNEYQSVIHLLILVLAFASLHLVGKDLLVGLSSPVMFYRTDKPTKMLGAILLICIGWVIFLVYQIDSQLGLLAIFSMLGLLVRSVIGSKHKSK